MDFEDTALNNVIQAIKQLEITNCSPEYIGELLESEDKQLITQALEKIQSDDSSSGMTMQTTTSSTASNACSASSMVNDGYQYSDDEIVNLIEVFLHKNPDTQGEILPVPIPVFDDVEKYREAINSTFAPSSIKIITDRWEQLQVMIKKVEQGKSVGIIFHTGGHWLAGMGKLEGTELHIYLADTMRGVDSTRQNQIKALMEETFQKSVVLYELLNPNVRNHDAQNKNLAEEDIGKLSDEEQLQLAIEFNKREQDFNSTFGKQGASSCGSYVVEYLKIMLSSSDYNQMNERVARLNEKSAADLRQEHHLTLLEEKDIVESITIKSPKKLAEKFIQNLKESEIIVKVNTNYAECKVAEYIRDCITGNGKASTSYENAIGELYEKVENATTYSDIRNYISEFCKMEGIVALGETN